MIEFPIPQYCFSLSKECPYHANVKFYFTSHKCPFLEIIIL